MYDDPLTKRLSRYVELTPHDMRLLKPLSQDRVRQYGMREDIIREGDEPSGLHLIVTGWACRYKMLEDGRRQILAFLIPGDMCDLNNFVLREMDHSLAALVPATVANLSHSQVAGMMAASPTLNRAFWWHSLTVVAMQREWTMNIGQRSAFERLGQLFCELFMRLRAVGLTRGVECDLPITQEDLAEASGLTPVHVNRTLQEMRARGLIHLRQRILEIPDFEQLAAASLFTPHYLHLYRGDEEMSAPRAVNAWSI